MRQAVLRKTFIGYQITKGTDTQFVVNNNLSLQRSFESVEKIY